jgi:LCP family protein required for cell wall assembly
METKRVAMLSIPRDLVVDVGGYQYRKINNAYSMGGIDLTREIAEEVTGLEMHYFGIIDFDGFKDIVNDLGGINVYVDNAFTDYHYPDYNFGYQTIKFEEGWQAFDGERALQYARSRNTLLNPSVISQVVDSVGNHFSTDAELWEMSRFAQLATEIDTGTIKNQVLDQDSSGVIHSEIASQTGAYVLIPNAGLGNYRDIQRIAKGLFDAPQEDVALEQATVEVQNGTTIEGYARQTSAELTAEGINVVSFSNASQRGQEVTVIYDLTGGNKPEMLAQLKELLGANSSTAIPSWLQNSSSHFATNTSNTNVLDPTVDFIVVLGYKQPPDYNVAEVEAFEAQPTSAAEIH